MGWKRIVGANGAEIRERGWFASTFKASCTCSRWQSCVPTGIFRSFFPHITAAAIISPFTPKFYAAAPQTGSPPLLVPLQ